MVHLTQLLLQGTVVVWCHHVQQILHSFPAVLVLFLGVSLPLPKKLQLKEGHGIFQEVDAALDEIAIGLKLIQVFDQVFMFVGPSEEGGEPKRDKICEVAKQLKYFEDFRW